MRFISSIKDSHNSKLYFSKKELSKILSFYSLGVSKGSWKDYAISFGKNETFFYMFKHSYASPDCILSKSKKIKKNIVFYSLEFKNIQKIKFNKLDDLIINLKRKEFKIIFLYFFL